MDGCMEDRWMALMEGGSPEDWRRLLPVRRAVS
jgi:hypothetical protein